MIEVVPEWMANLEDEDVVFIKKFLLASGSLKEIASQYGVTYPTVRLRLDRLIQKIQLGESQEEDPYVALVKRLAVNDKLDFDTAKILIHAYKKGGEVRMEVASRTLLIVLFFLWVVPVVLEVFLARTRSPIPGLVLPVLSFLLSLIPVLSVTAYGGICQVIGTMVMTLLIGNIMTLILLAIFFAVRHSRKKKSEMEKMNIQDL